MPLRSADDVAVMVAEELPAPPLPDPLKFMSKKRDDRTGQEWLGWSSTGARDFLMQCPRMVVMVPPQTLEEIQNPEKSPPHPVTWNGARWLLPKGRPVSVPVPIGEIVQNMMEPLRTVQARERRAYMSDIGDSMGPEIRLG